jgi:tRNA(fMet)-specific endonuclease VapC
MNDEEYILDTNILIYYFKGFPKIIALLKSLSRGYFFMSVISHMELMEGVKTPREKYLMKQFLNTLVPLDFRIQTADEATQLMKGRERKEKTLKIKDLFIAGTAKTEGLTLITADKDFTKIKGLKVKLVKP